MPGKKKKLTPAERRERSEKRRFKAHINNTFKNASFNHVPTRGTQFELAGRTGEIDAVYFHENILIVSEDTTLKRPDDIKKHLLKTCDFFDHIDKNKTDFIKLLDSTFPKFKEKKDEKFSDEDYKLKFLYCSRNNFDDKYKERCPNITFLDYLCLQYFFNLSRTIKKSVRFEIFKFLQLSLKEIGVQKSGSGNFVYPGFMLPESPSGFPKGYKVVSFLIEPSRLLEQSYVLRKDGWQDRDSVYQRLLIKRKIKTMREYLTKKDRVFINNIIATLPADTEIFDKDGKQQKISKMDKMGDVSIQLNKELNSIGIVDGQHRVFAYHEGIDDADAKISTMREKQHLLLTAVIYPENTTDLEKTKFEANLFLEINDRQTRVGGALKQVIETVVNPFSPVAISKNIITNLGKTGPLTGLIEDHFYDRGKIKTTSIVSYGLKHIVKLEGDTTLFNVWKKKGKEKLEVQEDKELLDEYTTFCTKQINNFISGFKMNIPDEMWTLSKKESKVLTTTTINGLIYCLRLLIQKKKTGTLEYYTEKFEKINIDFTPENFYLISSHWKELGELIYNQCFNE